MLLMQAQENRVALDEEQLLFLAGGQDNAIDEDVDEQPDCDAFDFDVDEAPTAQTMFMANLSSADPVYDEADPSYDSDILSEVHDHDHYQDAICKHHEEHAMHGNVQLNHVVDSHTDYTSDSNMIPYDQFELMEREQNINEQLRIVITDLSFKEETLKKELHSVKLQLEDTLEIAEITKRKMNDKMKDPECRIIRNNRDAHLDYLRHLKESVETIYDIVEEAKLAHTPLIRKKQVIATKPSDRQDSNKNKHVVTKKIQKTNVPVPHSTGVKRCPKASGSQPKSNHKTNRISPAKGRTDRPLVFGLKLLKTYDGGSLTAHEFHEKVIGTVRFGNDHFGAIMGYGDYMIGDIVISRVYYVEGLGHNLFSVGKFCDSDMEVAFRKHSCYV
nr:integrase, catalytic region, zinc finger, CCHC-type, peptidase aspartic, catalytic [Tanacetum cinerariifolium]